MSIRQNYAEGKFYPSNAKEIIQLLDNALESEKENIQYALKDKTIIGGVSPHAGHVFCAREAVHLFEIAKASEQQFDTVVLINPNHTGYGDPISVDSHTQWQSPLGIIDIDGELSDLLGLPVSPDAQRFEHSAEVIVPFIQHFLGYNVKLLPVNFFAQNFANAQHLAKRLKHAVDSLRRKILVVASSDFNHFKAPEVGYKLDTLALDALVSFELEEFEQRIKTHRISICGYGPIIALMEYARMESENAQMEILARGHSGEVHPSAEVVDYVSILVYR